MELWERQPGETAKAFYAFTLYRDMGYKRSISKVAQAYSEKTNLRGLMLRWSSKHNWVKRVKAYDDYLDLQARLEHEEELQKMHKRHLTLSMALQTKAAEKLKELHGNTMSTRDAISAVREGTKLERLTRGEPTEQVKGEVTATIQTPSLMPWENIPEVKAAVDKIREKLRKEKEAEQKAAEKNEQPT